MKIALVIEKMHIDNGGREMSTAQMARQFVCAGHDVSIISQQASWCYEGVEIITVPTNGVSKAARVQNFSQDVARVCKKRNFDIVHGMMPLEPLNVYQPRSGSMLGQARAAANRRGEFYGLLSSIVSHFNLKRQLERKYEADLIRNPDVACVCISEMIATEFTQLYDPPAKNIFRVYNSVDVPEVTEAQRQGWRNTRRDEIGAGDDTTVFLTIANNPKLKGMSYAIEAFEKFDGDGRLVVIGAKKTAKYKKLAAAKGLANKILFLPRTADVFSWYSAADAVLLLSWYDACSRVVLEAVRWCVPSITTAYNGAAEMLADGAGIVVGQPDDVNAVTAAMNKMADAEFRKKCSAACAEKSSLLTLERHIEELLEVYKNIMIKNNR